MLGHLDDEFEFGGAGGLFGFDESGEQFVELLLVLPGEDSELAAEPVGTAIFGDLGLGLSRLGATGLLCIAAVGRDLFGGCHKFISPGVGSFGFAPHEGIIGRGCAGFGATEKLSCWGERKYIDGYFCDRGSHGSKGKGAGWKAWPPQKAGSRRKLK